VNESHPPKCKCGTEDEYKKYGKSKQILVQTLRSYPDSGIRDVPCYCIVGYRIIELIIPKGTLIHESGIDHEYVCRAQQCIIKNRGSANEILVNVNDKSLHYGYNGDKVIVENFLSHVPPRKFWNTCKDNWDHVSNGMCCRDLNSHPQYMLDNAYTQTREDRCRFHYNQEIVQGAGIHFFWLKEQATECDPRL
jgi:hypothetical protein